MRANKKRLRTRVTSRRNRQTLKTGIGYQKWGGTSFGDTRIDFAPYPTKCTNPEPSLKSSIRMDDSSAPQRIFTFLYNCSTRFHLDCSLPAMQP